MREETLSALLADLSANRTDEDRENSRARLEQQHQECESRLGQMVRTHRDNLAQSVEVCSRVISTVTESKNKCRNLRERITNCMNMLQCNRDNLRKMWLESLQHHYAHKILKEIEELRKIPREVNESLINKKLEHATEVIVSSNKLLDNIECSADALKDLKSELYDLQEKLYAIVLEDLRDHLHMSTFLQNYCSKHPDDLTYDDVFTSKIPKCDYYFKDVLNEVNFDKVYVCTLLNCLVTMKRLPDAVQFLKDMVKSDLEVASHHISKFMHDIIQNSTDVSVLDLPIQKQQVFLIDLIENTIFVFLKISNNYRIFLSILQNILMANRITDIQFQLEDIYSKLQASIEYFVSYYLEPHPASAISSKDTFILTNSPNVNDISSFFCTHSLLEDKNSFLFKFSNSWHGISCKKYLKDTGELDSTNISQKSAKVALVCRPSIKNIKLLFNPLKNFISEIESALGIENADNSPMYAFLYDSANLFLDQVNEEIIKMLKNVSTNLEAWNTSTAGDNTNFKGNTDKQILSCSFILDNIIKDLQNLLSCLPDYSNHFLRLIYYVMLDYKEMSYKAFKQMFENEHNVLSVSWARDQDIRRLMKSFLNWRHLEDEETIDIIESSEDIRLRNKEESELLIRNLRSEDEFSWEIICDTSILSNLALLQENLIWFSVELLKFVKKFTQSQSHMYSAVDFSSGESSITSPVTGLRKVIKEYEDFADMCLLALHLEARARCFHYLLSFSVREICVESRFIQEFDAAVKHLTSDLLKMEEIFLPILTPKEFKYVFEGLGELVASLMILIVSNMSKINETVVLKIDRNINIVQCCLANITMVRDMSLERAHRFIDLLNLTHQEILDQIVEEGPKFSEREYCSVFRLIDDSITESFHGADYYTEKLKKLFESCAETVS